jgi:hypothetical protein
MNSHALAAAFVICAAVIATGGTTACGQDVCEKADDISEECSPPASSSGTVTPRETTRSKCSGTNEARAKCIVDHEAAYCAFLRSKGTPDPENAYLKCAAAVQ